MTIEELILKGRDVVTRALERANAYRTKADYLEDNADNINEALDTIEQLSDYVDDMIGEDVDGLEMDLPTAYEYNETEDEDDETEEDE